MGSEMEIGEEHLFIKQSRRYDGQGEKLVYALKRMVVMKLATN